jgi:hypothetical protein
MRFKRMHNSGNVAAPTVVPVKPLEGFTAGSSPQAQTSAMWGEVDLEVDAHGIHILRVVSSDRD